VLSETVSTKDLLVLQDAAAQVRVDESLVDYMLAIVERTRSHEQLAMGVSPRGAQALFRAAQAMAAHHCRQRGPKLKH
jgi:MoxR-like ATPase